MAASGDVKWTDPQRAGIETTGVSLLVSAAAGSGKTAVLAERCAYLVCDADPVCAVDQLLVVTFTEAAAAEMKGRIEAALRKRLDRNPADLRLQTQLALIDRAQVSTLHGFCSRLLRQHFHLVGLDPGFKILDADEASLLRSELARELFGERFETDDDGSFQKFVDDYGDGDDATLQAHVIRTHDLLCSLIDPDGWIADARSQLREGAANSLRQSQLGRTLAEIIGKKLSDLTDRCAKALVTIRSIPGFTKYAAYVSNLQGILGDWVVTFGGGNFDALATAVTQFSAARKPSTPKDAAGRAAAEAALDSVKDEMGVDGSLFAFIRFSAAEWAAGLRSILPAAGIFLDLVTEFASRYRAAKDRARGIDFADLERFTLRALGEEGETGRGPSAVARLCHRQIHQVLVDEYQDINELQEEILRLVSRECVAAPPGRGGGNRVPPNLFCVGDVKQSIYGFRLAEPARFLAKDLQFRTGDSSRARVIDLQSNFRSRAPLLEAINALFEKLMTQEAADITYDASHRLHPGASYPAAGENRAFNGAPVELHLLPIAATATDEDSPGVDGDAGSSTDDLDRTQREASFIADRIETMMGKRGQPPVQVFDKSTAGYRDLRYHDVVILLRSMRFKAEQVADVLRQHGVPVHRDSGTGYFDSVEIRDMLALLALLDNARQDVPLAAVLRSPLSGMAAAEDALARIRLAYPGGQGEHAIPFHDAAVRYAGEQPDELAARLRDFFDQLHRWRSVARQRPLADLIWTIYDESGYLTFCSGLVNGEQRCANLLHLHERARQFGTFARQGLYRFLKFLDALRDESDLGQPSVLGEGEDVVRVMSVHKSKGLEFPVVFLPDLGKRINLKSAQGPVLVDRLMHLGLMVVDEVKQVRYPSLPWLLVSRRIKQQSLAEELRVLYVAMTRAKEHLVLVGTCDEGKLPKWDTLWGEHTGPLPAEAVLSAGTMLDWLGSATAALRVARPGAYSRQFHTAAEISQWASAAADAAKPSPRQAHLAALKPLVPPPTKDLISGGVIERVTSVYPHEAFARLRASISVTEWAKRGTAEPERDEIGAGQASPPGAAADRRLPSPRFMNDLATTSAALSAADTGTATHLVLQHLDFQRPCRAGDLEDQITYMLHRRLLTKEQAAAVDRSSIEWFVGSAVGLRIRHTPPDDVLRELPFNYALPPEQLGSPSSNEPADQVMLRGRIDLLLKQSDGFHIVDYKTDNVRGESLEERVALYSKQVVLYRDALRTFTGLAAGTVHLVFLRPHVVREI